MTIRMATRASRSGQHSEGRAHYRDSRNLATAGFRVRGIGVRAMPDAVKRRDGGVRQTWGPPRLPGVVGSSAPCHACPTSSWTLSATSTHSVRRCVRGRRRRGCSPHRDIATMRASSYGVACRRGCSPHRGYSGCSKAASGAWVARTAGAACSLRVGPRINDTRAGSANAGAACPTE